MVQGDGWEGRSTPEPPAAAAETATTLLDLQLLNVLNLLAESLQLGLESGNAPVGLIVIEIILA